MPMNIHAAGWGEVRKLLGEARAALPSGGQGQPSPPASASTPLAGTLAEFEEFLEHNELELAWDSLASVAERLGASRAVWQYLAQAAALMQLGEKSDAAARRAAPLLPFPNHNRLTVER
jgi:hypothetical protein